MANTRELRLRIRSVANIQKITRAMQMIAASRLKRAQDVAMAAGPYSEKMAYLMQQLSGVRGSVKHPLLDVRPVENRLIVAIAGDKGLCGAYNTNVLRKMRQALDSGPPARVLAVGKKVKDHLRFRGEQPYDYISMPSAGPNVEMVQQIARIVVRAYVEAEVDHVDLVYTQFRSAVSTVPTRVQLLPLEVGGEEGGEEKAKPVDFIFEPDAESLLPLLLERYVQNQIYRGLVDAFASELGARMVAMKSATDNADELISDLRLNYNRIRQTAITTEILEVVSGAEALAD